jgi:DNA (cytosine-5)-methyltransferase 1
VNVLDLFSGIGGFSLGLERAGMKTIAFCEIEEFPRKVLRKHWPNVPIHKDVRTLHAKDITGTIDLICGGYPCQPFSCAGQRRGSEDDRHLWPEYLRLIQEIRPRWIIAENVAGHVSMGLDQVLSDLESENYACWTFIIPACSVNAPHRRDRLWIVANNRSERTKRLSTVDENKEGWAEFRTEPGGSCETSSNSEEFCSDGRRSSGYSAKREIQLKTRGKHCFFANTDSQRLEKFDTTSIAAIEGCFARSVFERITTTEWIAEPGVCPRNDGVSKGVAGRVAKLKALGNAVVPQIPELIGRAIMEVENRRITK